jgi:hypothetical protein
MGQHHCVPENYSLLPEKEEEYVFLVGYRIPSYKHVAHRLVKTTLNDYDAFYAAVHDHFSDQFSKPGVEMSTASMMCPMVYYKMRIPGRKKSKILDISDQRQFAIFRDYATQNKKRILILYIRNSQGAFCSGE